MSWVVDTVGTRAETWESSWAVCLQQRGERRPSCSDDGTKALEALLQVCPAIARAAFAAINIIKTVNYFGGKEKGLHLGIREKINYS